MFVIKGFFFCKKIIPIEMSIFRLEDESFYGQVVVGNIAKYQGKTAEPTKTHRWTCYVRGSVCFDVEDQTVIVVEKNDKFLYF